VEMKEVSGATSRQLRFDKDEVDNWCYDMKGG